MHSVSFRGTGTDELVPLTLSRVDVSDVDTTRIMGSWVYFDGHWEQYPGGQARYFAYYERRDHPESWAYVFLFLNGERGICQVRSINEALAALNCEIDRSGDAAD